MHGHDRVHAHDYDRAEALNHVHDHAICMIVLVVIIIGLTMMLALALTFMFSSSSPSTSLSHPCPRVCVCPCPLSSPIAMPKILRGCPIWRALPAQHHRCEMCPQCCGPAVTGMRCRVFYLFQIRAQFRVCNVVPVMGGWLLDKLPLASSAMRAKTCCVPSLSAILPAVSASLKCPRPCLILVAHPSVIAS